MSAVIKSRLLLAGLAVSSLMGCMRQYEAPTPGQPHAIVKFRRTYESTPGATLNELLVINDERAYGESVAAGMGAVPRTDALLVHPGSVQVSLRVSFTHQDSYTTQESYSCGTIDSPRQCSRTVTQQRTVTDGGCVQDLGLRFDEGTNYLLALNYQDSRNCNATCMIQEPLGDGKFKNRACVYVATEP